MIDAPTAVIRPETIHTQVLVNKGAESCGVTFQKIVSIGWEEREKRRYLQLGSLEQVVWYAYPAGRGVQLEDFLKDRYFTFCEGMGSIGFNFKLEAAQQYYGNANLKYGPYAFETAPGRPSEVTRSDRALWAPLRDVLGAEWRLSEEKGSPSQGLVLRGSGAFLILAA